MTEKEFLIKCREFMETFKQGYDRCLDSQAGLNDDYRHDRITYEEWKEEIEEIEKTKAFLREQLDHFSERFERLKKY